jgi:hypothetical protein
MAAFTEKEWSTSAASAWREWRRQTLAGSRTLSGSQPDYAFPETDGYDRSPKDTKAASFEFRRAVAAIATEPLVLLLVRGTWGRLPTSGGVEFTTPSGRPSSPLAIPGWPRPRRTRSWRTLLFRRSERIEAAWQTEHEPS